ncbi:MAG: hypothetical protein L0215_23315 [Gemmataceae bacterium]|nr:hypothetical protein [Gemmataceae bacterium]
MIVLLLLLPGRLQGLFFRDLFRGRRLLAMGKPEQSKIYSVQFLEQIRKRPWQKRLLWLNWGIYTTDVEVMALNNTAAAHLECGRLDRAESLFFDAIELDPKCPLPYFNLAIIAEIRGDREKAEAYVKEASVRGYTMSVTDKMVAMAGELLARYEGRGIQLRP